MVFFTESEYQMSFPLCELVNATDVPNILKLYFIEILNWILYILALDEIALSNHDLMITELVVWNAQFTLQRLNRFCCYFQL